MEINLPVNQTFKIMLKKKEITTWFKRYILGPDFKKCSFRAYFHISGKSATSFSQSRYRIVIEPCNGLGLPKD